MVWTLAALIVALFGVGILVFFGFMYGTNSQHVRTEQANTDATREVLKEMSKRDREVRQDNYETQRLLRIAPAPAVFYAPPCKHERKQPEVEINPPPTAPVQTNPPPVKTSTVQPVIYEPQRLWAQPIEQQTMVVESEPSYVVSQPSVGFNVGVPLFIPPPPVWFGGGHHGGHSFEAPCVNPYGSHIGNRYQYSAQGHHGGNAGDHGGHRR